MKKNVELNKKENSLVSQSLMTIFSILVFAIGASLITGYLLKGFVYVTDINISIKVEELLDNQLLIPDYFSDFMSYCICRIVLVAISAPLVFFFAIKDRFKGSYMNLVDLKKYKIILAGVALVYTVILGGYYFNLYDTAVKQIVDNNAKIQAYKADEKGYYNAGVSKVELLPIITIIVFSITGVITMYVAIITATSVNNKYLKLLLSSNQVVYEQTKLK